jgi:hypothetical protein
LNLFLINSQQYRRGLFAEIALCFGHLEEKLNVLTQIFAQSIETSEEQIKSKLRLFIGAKGVLANNTDGKVTNLRTVPWITSPIFLYPINLGNTFVEMEHVSQIIEKECCPISYLHHLYAAEAIDIFNTRIPTPFTNAHRISLNANEAKLMEMYNWSQQTHEHFVKLWTFLYETLRKMYFDSYKSILDLQDGDEPTIEYYGQADLDKKTGTLSFKIISKYTTKATQQMRILPFPSDYHENPPPYNVKWGQKLDLSNFIPNWLDILRQVFKVNLQPNLYSSIFEAVELKHFQLLPCKLLATLF